MKEKGMIRRILLPLDASGLAEKVLPYVEDLALATKAEVFLLQVVASAPDMVLVESYTPPVADLVDNYIKEVSSAAGSYLNKIKERLSEKGIVVYPEVRIGSPADKIIDFAKEKGIDLIAMSTHGRSGFSRWVFGSVADKVLHAAETPVLLIRSAGTP